MKKLIFKTTLMVLVMVGFSNYVMYLMTGKSPFSFSELPSFSSANSTPTLSDMLPAGKEQAYKWKDANGVVHYSSEAPPEGLDAQLIEVDPNTNLVQGISTKSEPEDAQATSTQPEMPSGNIYNPNTIKKLMDDAKGVQETLNKRYEDLEKVK